ncbi:MAG: hypothetical protein LBB79_10280 [Prevotellaceae bacterium]|jgi:hypothetical protein|nr:hypothetical protein [Prevotellaceae bacterium]
MKAFTKIIGIIAVGAAMVAGAAGCNVADDEKDGYTLRFKVDNDTNLGDMPTDIKKIEFINGDRQNDNVLRSIIQTLPPANRSMEYRVSGFTMKDECDSARHKCGVRITFEDDDAAFDWDAFGHGSKVLVSVDYFEHYYEGRYTISFSDGEERW